MKTSTSEVVIINVKIDINPLKRVLRTDLAMRQGPSSFVWFNFCGVMKHELLRILPALCEGIRKIG
jgi:hypothetical protein